MGSSATQQLAEALIARASVTPEDAGCQAVIGERLAALGYAITDLSQGRVRNLLALSPATAQDSARTETPLCLFVGHTDVVPPGPESGWVTPAFTPSVREGVLYGRGAADMKASVAAFVTACERLAANQTATPRIGLLLTSDEEGPGDDGIRGIIEQLPALTGPITWCLVGEPSSQTQLGDTLRVGRRGSLSGELTITGQQGHVAYPDLADNPLHRLMPILSALAQTQWDAGTEQFPPTTLQITGVESDTDAVNVIPGQARARFNLRFSPASTAESLQQRIEAITHEQFGSTQPSDQVHFDWRCSAVPFESPAGPLRACITQAIEQQLGITPVANTAGGTSDGRFIAPLGAEVVELGPMNASIHQVNECIRIDDLNALSSLYEQILADLAAHCE